MIIKHYTDNTLLTLLHARPAEAIRTGILSNYTNPLSAMFFIKYLLLTGTIYFNTLTDDN